MDRVFNMGIGLVIVVAEHFAEADRAPAEPSAQAFRRGSSARWSRVRRRCPGNRKTTCRLASRNRCTDLAFRVSYWVHPDAVRRWPPRCGGTGEMEQRHPSF